MSDDIRARNMHAIGYEMGIAEGRRLYRQQLEARLADMLEQERRDGQADAWDAGAAAGRDWGWSLRALLRHNPYRKGRG